MGRLRVGAGWWARHRGSIGEWCTHSRRAWGGTLPCPPTHASCPPRSPPLRHTPTWVRQLKVQLANILEVGGSSDALVDGQTGPVGPVRAKGWRGGSSGGSSAAIAVTRRRRRGCCSAAAGLPLPCRTLCCRLQRWGQPAGSSLHPVEQRSSCQRLAVRRQLRAAAAVRRAPIRRCCRCCGCRCRRLRRLLPTEPRHFVLAHQLCARVRRRWLCHARWQRKALAQRRPKLR